MRWPFAGPGLCERHLVRPAFFLFLSPGLSFTGSSVEQAVEAGVNKTKRERVNVPPYRAGTVTSGFRSRRYERLRPVRLGMICAIIPTSDRRSCASFHVRNLPAIWSSRAHPASRTISGYWHSPTPHRTKDSNIPECFPMRS